jgi:hypothetical protein
MSSRNAGRKTPRSGCTGLRRSGVPKMRGERTGSGTIMVTFTRLVQPGMLVLQGSAR